METKPNKIDRPNASQLAIIIPAYRMHTQTFLGAVADFSDDDALTRIDGRTNHMVWMAGNFVNMRYAMASVLGLQDEDPHQHLFYMGKTLDESFSYPTLSELVNNFHFISPKVYQSLLHAEEELLAEPFIMQMGIPFIEENKLNFIGMGIGRADYLCGQMALMRRILNYPPMKYDVDEKILY